MVMESTMNIKRMLSFAMMALVTTTTFAQHRHHHHVLCRPVVVTVVRSPAVQAPARGSLSVADRLELALAYLRGHRSLRISKYSEMAGLTPAEAEAELDAFAISDNNPIKMVRKGRKKLYVI